MSLARDRKLASWLVAQQHVSADAARAAEREVELRGGRLLPQLVAIGALEREQAVALRDAWREERRARRKARESGSSVGSASRSTDLGGAIGERFRVIGEVGRGGAGVVYHVVDRSDGRDRVLKLLHVGSDARARERMRREARALAGLNHPQIMRIDDSGETEDGRAWLLMPLIRGRTLEAILEDRAAAGESPSPEAAVALLRGVAEALAHCHESGVVHRDVKPANILIQGTTGPGRDAGEASLGAAILVDFGLVRRAGGVAERLTNTGELVGTPAFMAPEQLSVGSGERPREDAMDVWGFGATLFHTLTGRPPFQGALQEILGALAGREAPRLRSVDPDTPVWLDDLVADCLARRPERRPRMAEVLARLDRGPAGAGRRLPRRALFGGALGLMLLLGAVLWLAGRDREPPELSLAATAATRRESELELTGQVRDASAVVVQVRGPQGMQEARVGPDGTFRCRVVLGPGENRFVVVAVDAGGLRAAPVERWITLDRRPPTITLTPPRVVHRAELVLPVVLDEAGRLSVDGREVPLRDGQGEIRRPLQLGENVLILDARDAAGNAVRRELRVVRKPLLTVGPSASPEGLETFARYDTLEAALAVATEGSRILLQDGFRGRAPRLDRSVELVGPRAGQATLTGVALTGLELAGGRVLLRRLTIIGAALDGARAICLSGGRARLEDCLIKAPAGRGVTVGARAGSTLTGESEHELVLVRCTIRECRAGGLSVSNKARALLRDTLIERNGEDGLFVALGGRIRAERVRLKGNKAGVYVRSAGRLTMSDCRVEQSRREGVFASDPGSHITLSETRVTESGSAREARTTRPGVFLAGRAEGELRGGRISAGTGDAIIVAGGAGLLLHGLEITDHGDGVAVQISDSGSRASANDLTVAGAALGVRTFRGGRFRGRRLRLRRIAGAALSAEGARVTVRGVDFEDCPKRILERAGGQVRITAE